MVLHPPGRPLKIRFKPFRPRTTLTLTAMMCAKCEKFARLGYWSLEKTGLLGCPGPERPIPGNIRGGSKIRRRLAQSIFREVGFKECLNLLEPFLNLFPGYWFRLLRNLRSSPGNYLCSRRLNLGDARRRKNRQSTGRNRCWLDPALCCIAKPRIMGHHWVILGLTYT